MTMIFPSLGVSNLFVQWRQPATAQPAHPRSEADEARMNRAVMHDMMSYRPEAVQSELNLMLLQARFRLLY